MISVEEARRRLFAAAPALCAEEVPLADATGRVAAADILAARTQPPFSASAMDGYAVRAADGVGPLRLVGTAAAGHRYRATLGPKEAVRIFTGAPVPEGADAIAIQEDVAVEGEAVRLAEPVEAGTYVRREGLDFAAGTRLALAGERLAPRHVALIGAGGHASVAVSRRPRVAFLATGDELKAPGEPTGPDDIVASVTPALMAMVREAGAVPLDLGIAPDDRAVIAARAREGLAAADILVTLGGASVGDHDLVRPVLADLGVALDFWKVAVRPGKPLMFAPDPLVLGLPGNPVSGIVCTLLFLCPLVLRMQGVREPGPHAQPARLGAAVGRNGPRRDHMRARRDENGRIVPFSVQDSSMLSVLRASDVLLLREPHAPPAEPGEPCFILPL